MTREEQEKWREVADATIAKLRAHIAALVAVVKAVEWDEAWNKGIGICPWCHGPKRFGHATNCALASALALVREGE